MRTYVAVLGLVLLACEAEATAGKAEATAGSAEENPFDTIQRATSLADALAIAKPKMGDGVEQVSAGALLLTYWGIERMRWSDVERPLNGTSALRGPADEPGKGLCVEGTVAQLNEDRFQKGVVYTGILQAPDLESYHFAAVGKPGDVAAGRQARFCGIVSGKFEYADRNGDQSTAIQLVGMFDVPENRRLAKLESPAP